VRKLKILFFKLSYAVSIILTLTSPSIAADSLSNTPIYNNNKGSLNTLQNVIIPNNSYLQIVKNNHPFVTVKAYDKDGTKLFEGRDLEIAKYWFDKSVTVSSFNDVVELISEPLNIVPAHEMSLEDCLRTNNSTDLIRTVAGSPSIRLSDDLGEYFSCYQKKTSAITRYTSKISPAIKKVTDNYGRVWQTPLPSAEFETLLSCLIYRESSHFTGNSSPSGAVGIGQFTHTAIKHLKKILTVNLQTNFESRLAPRIQQLNQGSISETTRRKLNKEVSLIKAEQRNNYRNLTIKKF
jgi:hypothetical protein